MLMTGTLRPGATLGPPLPPTDLPAPVIAVMGGEPRIGAFVTVSNTGGRPCYVQVMVPGTEDFDKPFIEINLDNPVPMFELTADHMGRMVRVISKGVDALGRPDGNDVVSNVIGPILHAVDPVGTTVSNSTEFGAAIAPGATIILAAGTVWNTDFLTRRNLSGVTVTTQQDNPAVISDTILRPGTLTNVVFEGLVFRYSRAWSQANRASTLLTGTSSDGITMRGCQQIGDNVTREEYQAVPPSRAQSPYVNTGMTFVPQGFEFHRSRNITLEGHLIRNTFRGLTIPTSTTFRGVRIHGWYFDGTQINGSFSSQSDRLDIRGYYCSTCYGIYNEMSSVSPHMDALQGAAGAFVVQPIVDMYVNLIGDTRATAFGGVVTNLISEQQWRDARFRRCLWTGSGSINAYMTGRDHSFAFCTKALVGTAAGGGATRFGPAGSFNNEARIESSIFRERANRVGFGPDAYYVENDSNVPVSTLFDQAIAEKLFGPVSQRADTLAELALMLRPRPGFEGRGALTESGHIRAMGDMPAPPAISAMPGTGSWSLSLAGVSGAQRYEVRYRPTGSSGAWTRDTGAGTTFAASGLAAGSYDVQAFVRTSDGLSRWGDVQTVVVS